MRLFIYLFVITLFSCNQKVNSNNVILGKSNIQNEQDKTKGNLNQETEQVKTIDLPFSSDKLNYSKKDKNGYYIYDDSFKKQKLNRLSRTIGKYSFDNNITIFLVELKPKGDEHIDPIVTLYSYFKEERIDSLVVYENIQWEGSFKKSFVIGKDKIIKISEASKGNDVTESGANVLITSNSNDVYNVSSKGFFVSNKWIGRYFFETKNKDNLKTSFDISIQDLNNITIKYIGDGNSPEVYKNLVGEQLSSDKIRIVFNKKYEELGEINLEKDGDVYSISGQAISFINPGNDNYPIKKMKL